MADDITVESPQVPEPTAPAPQTPDPTQNNLTPQEAAQALLTELDSLNITEPDQIQNMATASREAGIAAQRLGESRQYSKDLEDKIRLIEAQQQMGLEDDTYSERPLSKKDVEGAMDNWLQKQQAVAMQAQQMNLAALADVQSDPDYGNEHVQKVWNQHLSNPGVQAQIQSGQTSIRREFDRVTKRYYRLVAQRSGDTIKGLMGARPGTLQPPHMESGLTQSIPLPTGVDANEEKLNKIITTAQPTDDAIDEAFAMIIPDGDPITQI